QTRIENKESNLRRLGICVPSASICGSSRSVRQFHCAGAPRTGTLAPQCGHFTRLPARSFFTLSFLTQPGQTRAIMLAELASAAGAEFAAARGRRNTKASTPISTTTPPTIEPHSSQRLSPPEVGAGPAGAGAPSWTAAAALAGAGASGDWAANTPFLPNSSA